MKEKVNVYSVIFLQFLQCGMTSLMLIFLDLILWNAIQNSVCGYLNFDFMEAESVEKTNNGDGVNWYDLMEEEPKMAENLMHILW